MADNITEGFGANPPVQLAAGALEVITRYLRPTQTGFTRIRQINLAAQQFNGAIIAAAYIPVFVIRGPSSIGQGANPGQLSVLLRPAATDTPGFPTVSQISGGLELLYCAYVKLAAQSLPLEFSEQELIAGPGRALAVISAPVVDATAAPALFAAPAFGQVVSVLGESGEIGSQGTIVGFGSARSLPRYDVKG